jgi:hypothetical protein
VTFHTSNFAYTKLAVAKTPFRRICHENGKQALVFSLDIYFADWHPWVENSAVSVNRRLLFQLSFELCQFYVFSDSLALHSMC